MVQVEQPRARQKHAGYGQMWPRQHFGAPASDRSGPCSPPTHRASAPREPCLPPGSSEALHSVAACVHGPIWICQVALAPTAVCARGMRAHCRPPVCAQSRSLHTSSSLFKSGGCGALDAVKAFILSASFHPGHMHMHFAGDSKDTRGSRPARTGRKLYAL